MNPIIWSSLGGVLGIFTTAIGNYLINRRKLSGRINDTDAAKLWEESQAMRKELRDECARLRQILNESDKRLKECEERWKR